MRANGKTIIWKVSAYMFGMMEESMKANIRMIKNMDLECILGQMADVMKVIGGKVNSME